MIERSVETYARERHEKYEGAAAKQDFTFPIIHSCMKEMEARVQLLRNIVRESPTVVTIISKHEHPLASHVEMV